MPWFTMLKKVKKSLDPSRYSDLYQELIKSKSNQNVFIKHILKRQQLTKMQYNKSSMARTVKNHKDK